MTLEGKQNTLLKETVMKKINNSRNIALAFVAALGMASIAAHASEVRVLTVTVHYSDLKPQQAAGAKVLYRRIRNAAEQVCGDEGSRQLQEAMAARACVDQAVLAGIRAVQATLSVADVR
jgi:UrcA family protein